MGRVAQASLAAVGLLTPASRRAVMQDDQKEATAAGHRKARCLPAASAAIAVPDANARLRRRSGMTPEQRRPARDTVALLHVVVNHLRLREPVPDATVEAARKGMQLVVDAGALAARVAKVDETHLILILEFSTAEDADRIAREVGGPWMRENIRPLLAGDTERSVAEVIASAEG